MCLFLHDGIRGDFSVNFDLAMTYHSTRLLSSACDALRRNDHEGMADIMKEFRECLLENHLVSGPAEKKLIELLNRRYMTYTEKSGRHAPQRQPALLPGVSLVTCCMNRTENLLKAIPTWVAVGGIDEFIIVDWNSSISVSESLRDAGQMDSRIRILRVDNEPRWILSYAFNLGFRYARRDSILKVDADILIQPDFLGKNLLSDGEFIAGDWRHAEKGQEHVNGFFFVRRQDLFKVGGFNEYITTYGWDDDDLYERLDASGLARRLVDLSSIYHMPHEDSLRIEMSDDADRNIVSQLKNDTLFKIRTNKNLVEVVPAWGTGSTFAPFRVTSEDAAQVKLRRVHGIVPHAATPEEQQAAIDMATRELVYWRTGCHVDGLSDDKFNALVTSRSFETIGRVDLAVAASLRSTPSMLLRPLLPILVEIKLDSELTDMLRRLFDLIRQRSMEPVFICERAADGKLIGNGDNDGDTCCTIDIDLQLLQRVTFEELLASRDGLSLGKDRYLVLDRHVATQLVGELRHPGPITHGRHRLYIDAQHGLGNRLRAIASAASVASAGGRELVIIWEPDHHCDCRFADLFDYDGEVIERSFRNGRLENDLVMYNYMEIEKDAHKDETIVLVDGKDVYVRSAYVLNSPLSSWATDNAFLQELQPVARVRDLVELVGLASPVLGVHVRMEGARGTPVHSYDSVENWTQEGHEYIQQWRAASHYTVFMRKIDAIIASEHEMRIFLAADMADTYDAFRRKYGERLYSLKRDVYDRSRGQLLYALADALLLSRCDRLLGSTWSSFTELAMRLSHAGIRAELSGTDF